MPIGHTTTQPVTESHSSAKPSVTPVTGRTGCSHEQTAQQTPTVRSSAQLASEPVEAVQPTIPFENLASLDTTPLHAIFCTVDREVLRLALASADDTLVAQITSQLPKKLARQLRDSLHELGPTRLSDVRRARQLLAATATQFLSDPSPQRYASST